MTTYTTPRKMFLKAVLIIMGIFIFAFGIKMFTKNFSYNNNLIKTTATVVDVQEKVINNAKRYYPVFKYKIDNQTIKSKSFRSTGVMLQYKKGDKVTVYYNKKNVKRVVAKKDQKYLFLGIALILIGLDFIIVFGILGKSEIIFTWIASLIPI